MGGSSSLVQKPLHTTRDGFIEAGLKDLLDRDIALVNSTIADIPNRLA
jgi:hypothetical protein